MINQSAIAVVLLLISTTFAEKVRWEACTSSSEDVQCTIHNVDVEPCKEAESEKPCVLKLGKDAQISFNYTANFTSEKPFSQAYWKNDIIDLPLIGMNTDACKNTQCPILPGADKTYSIKLHMNKAFPKNAYPVKWRLRNEDNKECCFIIHIRLV